MKLIHHSKISETKCPTHDFCRGKDCAVFKWYGYYNYKKVYFEPKFKWTDYLNPLEWFGREENRQREAWVPPELEGWTFEGFATDWEFKFYASYYQVNNDRQWYCGLQGER